jgi:2'-5' RNA ligase
LSLRLFLALVPPPETRASLARLARSLRHGGRAVPAANLHITLAFLGTVTAGRARDAAAVADGFAGSGGFELCLETVGHWPRPRVLWCAPQRTPAALASLAGALAAALRARGFELERRRFAAHLTLARKVSHYAGHNRLREPVLWDVDSMQLVASRTRPEGARYRVLRAVRLQA